MASKDQKYVKTNSVNPLYIFFNKVNGYFEEINEYKYLMLVPTNKSNEKIKNMKKSGVKSRDLTRSITKKPQIIMTKKIYEYHI